MVYGLRCSLGGYFFDLDCCKAIGLMIEKVWTNPTLPYRRWRGDRGVQGTALASLPSMPLGIFVRYHPVRG